MFVHIIFSSVWVAELTPLGKSLVDLILTICNCFEGRIRVLSASVPRHRLLVSFICCMHNANFFSHGNLP